MRFAVTAAIMASLIQTLLADQAHPSNLPKCPRKSDPKSCVPCRMKEPPPPAHCNCIPYDYNLYNWASETYFVNSEFLYWTVQENAIDYALKMAHPAWGPDTNYAQGHVKSATFDLDPGVRVAVGYFNAPKYYEAGGQYTHIINRGKNSASKPEGDDLFLTGTWPQITTNPLTHAHSNIFFDYNLIEIYANRVFNPNPHMRLRLHAGGIAAWMHQDWKIHYFDAESNIITVRNRWRYTAAGLSLGSTIDWYWGMNIYVTGQFAASGFMGSYRNRATQTSTFQKTGEDDPTIPLRDADFKDTRPALALQFSAGPAWQQSFGTKRVELFAGYEMNTWFNLQEVRRSTVGAPKDPKQTWIASGLLALHGLTTRLSLNF